MFHFVHLPSVSVKCGVGQRPDSLFNELFSGKQRSAVENDDESRGEGSLEHSELKDVEGTRWIIQVHVICINTNSITWFKRPEKKRFFIWPLIHHVCLDVLSSLVIPRGHFSTTYKPIYRSHWVHNLVWWRIYYVTVQLHCVSKTKGGFLADSQQVGLLLPLFTPFMCTIL